MAGQPLRRGASPQRARGPAPARPLSAAEARAAALLAEIRDDELDALAVALARLLLSAAKNRAQPRPLPAQKRAARG